MGGSWTTCQLSPCTGRHRSSRKCGHGWRAWITLYSPSTAVCGLNLQRVGWVIHRVHHGGEPFGSKFQLSTSQTNYHQPCQFTESSNDRPSYVSNLYLGAHHIHPLSLSKMTTVAKTIVATGASSGIVSWVL